MKKLKILLSVVAMSFIMVGCVGTEPKEVKRFNESDFGKKPNVSKFQYQIEEKIKSRLKDPYSAKFTKCSQPPLKSSMYNGIAGWTSICEVNAKNSYGGYTGFKKYSAFIIYGSKTNSHMIMEVEELSEALKNGLIIFGVNDKY